MHSFQVSGVGVEDCGQAAWLAGYAVPAVASGNKVFLGLKDLVQQGVIRVRRPLVLLDPEKLPVIGGIACGPEDGKEKGGETRP